MRQVYEVADYQGILSRTKGEIHAFTSRQKAVTAAQTIANVTHEPEYVEICDMLEDGEYQWGANDIRILPEDKKENI